jgi:hypothetical protein
VNEHRESISELLVKIEGEFDGMADDPSTTELACSRCAEHVNDLRSRSLRIGVTSTQLERLIHLVTRADCDANQSPSPRRHSKRSKTALSHTLFALSAAHLRLILMRACVPCEQVPVRELENLIAAFASLRDDLQSLVLRFVGSVLDHIDDATALRGMYAALFHWLDYGQLRPYVALILYRITLREHCAPFRVRRLQALLKRSSADKALRALASVYQQYAPLAIAAGAFDASAFGGPHALDVQAWLAEIALARTRANTPTVAPTGLPLRALNGAVRSAISAHNARPVTTVVTVDEVDTAEGLVDALERLQLPDRMSAILSNEWLQHFVALAPSDAALVRVQQWLAFSLDSHVRWRNTSSSSSGGGGGSGGDGDGGGGIEVRLASLAQLTRFLGETLLVVERFLAEYLRTASGDANFTATSDSTLFSLLTLVEHVRPMPFEQLHASFLSSLQTLFYGGGATVKARVLACLRRLCVNWASVDWAAVREQALTVPDAGDGATAVSDRYVRNPMLLHMDHFAAVHALLRFVERLSTLALQAHHHHPLLQHHALAFFEFATQLHREYRMPFCYMPPASLVLSALVGSSASALSRVCELVTSAAEEMHAMRQDDADSKALRQGSVVSSGIEHRDQNNERLLDVVAVLWAKGIFSDEKGRLRGAFGMTPDAIAAVRARFGADVGDTFLVARHPALAPFGAEYARSVASDDAFSAGSRKRRIGDEPAALVQEQRKSFVMWLTQEHKLGGIESFLTRWTQSFKQAK